MQFPHLHVTGRGSKEMLIPPVSNFSSLGTVYSSGSHQPAWALPYPLRLGLKASLSISFAPLAYGVSWCLSSQSKNAADVHETRVTSEEKLYTCICDFCHIPCPLSCFSPPEIFFLHKLQKVFRERRHSPQMALDTVPGSLGSLGLS